MKKRWFFILISLALMLCVSAQAQGTQLSAPVVDAPESVVIGEDFTVTVEPVPDAEHYQLILFDSPDPETWQEMAEVTVDGDPGTMTVSTANLQPGEYMWWVGVWYGDDVMNGDITTGTVQVMQPEPVVTAPESVVIGEDFTVAVEPVPYAEHCQLILFDSPDPETWQEMAEATVDGMPSTMTVSTDNLLPGEYTWWVGVWPGDDVMHGGKTTGTVTAMLTPPDVDPNRVITLNLPAALTKIEEEAFSGLTAQKVIINASGSVHIDPRAFADSSVIVVEIPENVSFVPQGGIVVMTR